MRRSIRLLFAAPILLLVIPAVGAEVPECDYYVSHSFGDDGYDGTLPFPNFPGTNGPWRTVSKVSASAFQPGDTVCFYRDDTWDLVDEGPLVIDDDGQPGDPITVRAYGAGYGRPVLTAARDISGANWTEVAPDEWALVNEPSLDLSNPGPVGVVLAEDAASLEPFHLWRGSSWSPPHPAGALFEEREWAWNEATSTLHVFDSSGEPGHGGLTSVVVAQRPWGQGYGVRVSGSHVAIQDLQVQYVAGPGLQLDDVDTFTISDVVAQYNNAGISVLGGDAGTPDTYNQILDSLIEHNFNAGITNVRRGNSSAALVHTMVHRVADNEVHDNGQVGIFWRFFEETQDARVPVIESNEVSGGGWYKQSPFGYAAIAMVYRGARDPGPVVRYNETHHYVTPAPAGGYTHQLDGGGIMLRADRAEASYNIVYENEGSGIAAGFMSEGPPTGVVITNNTLFHNCQAAKDDDDMPFTKRGELRIEGRPGQHPDDVFVANNIMVLDPTAMRPHLVAIYDPSSLAEIDDNVYHCSGGCLADEWFWVSGDPELDFATYQAQYGLDPNSSYEDPRIETNSLDPDFLQLRFDSPCIDDGSDPSTILSQTPTRDFWGNATPHPTGGDWDIGAHELHYTPLP